MQRFAFLLSLLVCPALGDPFQVFLKAQAGKSSFSYQAACKSMGQTPGGYGMSGAGGVQTFSITCNTNKIIVKCAGMPFTSCTSSYKPPASAGSSKPTGRYNVKAAPGNCNGGMTAKEIQAILDLQNKMRCAVGSPPLQWNGALQCQAQSEQNRIGAFVHSKSYGLPIPAGENLAGGTNVATAAWMWFTEYTQTMDYANNLHLSGHYSAMSWKGVTQVGCGIQRSGKGVIRCQYKGSPLPNMAGSYGANVPKFQGSAAALSKCGLTIAEVKGKVQLFQKWGILKPASPMDNSLGLYSTMDALWHSSSSSVVAGCACLLAFAAAVSMMALRFRRRGVARTVDVDEELSGYLSSDLE